MWFNLADEVLEESIYDSYAMRTFMRLDFSEESVPDATILLNFRHLLEKHKITETIFEIVKKKLEENGKILHGGTVIDATIIEAPSATKNSSHSRDPEMHQTKKGNGGTSYQWHFEM